MPKQNNRLKMAIAATGLYQYEFADKIGVPDWLISRVIRGRVTANLTPEDKEKITDGLRELIGDEKLRDTLMGNLWEE